ncbi:TRAP transporter small permease [Thermodesulfobacteriota bacterium]
MLRVTRILNFIACIIGSLALAIILILTTTDVLLRWLISMPVRGSFEIIEYLMVLVAFLFLADTEAKRGHVGIELVISRLPTRIQASVNMVTTAMTLLFIGIVAWRGLREAINSWQVGQHSPDLEISAMPFRLVVAIGAGLLFLELLWTFREHLLSFAGQRKKD